MSGGASECGGHGVRFSGGQQSTLEAALHVRQLAPRLLFFSRDRHRDCGGHHAGMGGGSCLASECVRE